MVTSYLNGWEIYYDESLKRWVFSSPKTVHDSSRPCKECDKYPMKEEDCSCTEPKTSKSKLKTKFVPISDELWDTIKDTDRVIFTKGGDSTQGLIFYSE